MIRHQPALSGKPYSKAVKRISNVSELKTHAECLIVVIARSGFASIVYGFIGISCLYRSAKLTVSNRIGYALRRA